MNQTNDARKIKLQNKIVDFYLFYFIVIIVVATIRTEHNKTRAWNLNKQTNKHP